MEARKSRDDQYVEILRPPIWLLAFILFLLESLALSIWAAFNDAAGIFSAVVAIFLVLAFRQSMAMKIEVTQEELRIGRAHVERKFLDAPIALGVDQMRLTRGRDADPAAYLAIRFWEPTGIKVSIRDSRDPTPYWLISSKYPEKLSAALASL